jgi:hypothetical protein
MPHAPRLQQALFVPQPAMTMQVDGTFSARPPGNPTKHEVLAQEAQYPSCNALQQRPPAHPGKQHA